ncbi:hypothetical protein HMPREF1983_01426 [Gemella bergeri ATCC 700627]|uniref:Uncharacterized protein n=1 Tax=Gemella bergeri ATCC 700627 TaxID=1321820 RepID=U2QJ48_9BACL|nr:hypothetical protein [Gemella bergeri]ERK56239.1 hypothetical protein HMPREF1983_01426 [Gemella bergeri ATCC 700627]
MTKKIEELIYEETEKRLKKMEDPTYIFPSRISNIDMIIIIGLLITSMVLIYLCAIGVIS